MAELGAEWWGGSLTDGSLVVLSPSGRALLLSDSSSPSGLQPGVGKRKASSFTEWAGIRSGVAFPYEKGGYRIGVRRGTILLVVSMLLVAIPTVGWLVEGVLRLPTTSFMGGLITLALGTLTCVALLALVYVIEVVPLKREGVRFFDVTEDDDDYLRYVHPSVASTEEWETLVGVAQEHSPPSEKSSGIHSLLWEAAGIKPTLDAGEIRDGDKSRLSEIALLARGL